MKLTLLSLLLIGILFTASCSDDDSVSPGGDEITGSYSGTFSYRKPYEEVLEVTEDKPLIVSRHKNHPTVLNVSIQNFAWIVVLHNITYNGGSKYSGTTYVYNSTSDVGVEDHEVAGSGSFYYENDELHILWTADPINDEWNFSYTGKKN